MSRSPQVLLLLSLTFAVRAAAADPETQHAFDVTLPLKPNLDLILHTRLRTQPGGLGFYQVRAGPIFSWKASGRLALLAGYYHARQEGEADRGFIAGHRLFGGAEVAVASNRRLALDQRALAERFLPGAGPDFNRYRLRNRLSVNAPLSPYASQEFFLDARGWRSVRHSAGVRWSPLRGVQFDLGYLYEHRRPDAGGNRHLWLTSLHFKKPSRRTDPDL